MTHTEKAKKLKALGLIDYDLRKKLTRGQKWWVSTLYNRTAEVIRHPEKFEPVKASDSKERKVLRADYVGSKDRFFVPKGAFDEVKLVRGSKGADPNKDPAAFFAELFNAPFITREAENKIEFHFLIPGLELDSAIEKAMDKVGTLQTPGWVWTFAFKGCNPFVKVRASLSGAFNYLQQMLKGNHIKATTQQEAAALISGLVLIARRLDTSHAVPIKRSQKGKA
jgi:hypothetical protein